MKVSIYNNERKKAKRFLTTVSPFLTQAELKMNVCKGTHKYKKPLKRVESIFQECDVMQKTSTEKIKHPLPL